MPAGTPDPPPVAVFPVAGRAADRAGPAGRRAALVVAGDGEGLVDIAGARHARRRQPSCCTRRRTPADRAALRKQADTAARRSS